MHFPYLPSHPFSTTAHMCLGHTWVICKQRTNRASNCNCLPSPSCFHSPSAHPSLHLHCNCFCFLCANETQNHKNAASVTLFAILFAAALLPLSPTPTTHTTHRPFSLAPYIPVPGISGQSLLSCCCSFYENAPNAFDTITQFAAAL